MAPGIAKVEAAKIDGTWNALDAVENLEIPPDLETAFAEHSRFRSEFRGVPEVGQTSGLRVDFDR